MQYKKYILKNGLSFVSITGLSTKSVTITAFLRAGFRFDPPDKPGIAHFAEHMVFNGTQSFPTTEKEALAIEQYGGWHGAFTWIEHQKHTVHLPKSYFETGLKLLMETLSSPLIKQSEIAKERKVIKEEIYTNKSDSSKAIWDYVWTPLLFHGTHLARPYSGTENDLDLITKADLDDFINKYFIPKNIIIFIAGDIEPKRIRKEVEKNSRLFTTGGKSVDIPSLNFPKKTENILVHNDSSYYKTSICVGVKTVPYGSIDQPVFEIIREILCGYSGTRLIQTLRNKGGLIYDWHIYSDYISDTGYLFFNASTSHRNVDSVTSIVLDEFERLASGKITDKEILIAKQHLIGSIYANFETGQDYIEWYGMQELLNSQHVLSIEERVKLYKKISNDKIREIASSYLKKQNIFIGAIGNVSKTSFPKTI
ncbi:MAG TPA: pitrilysin family protein [Patescibacteria group bacterium]|jgi:predicted Zn-dependent peptidase|nr:pitrilysin family protein [Patescibacteria group bacterium]